MTTKHKQLPEHILQLNFTEAEFKHLINLLDMNIKSLSGDFMGMIEAHCDMCDSLDELGEGGLNKLIRKFNLGTDSIDCGNPDCNNHQLLRGKKE